MRLKTEHNWECEQCHLVTRRLAVHHTIPVEKGSSLQEMEDICFCQGKYRNIQRLQVLCYDCHSRIHQAEGSRSRAGHQDAESKRIERYHNGTIHEEDLITL